MAARLRLGAPSCSGTETDAVRSALNGSSAAAAATTSATGATGAICAICAIFVLLVLALRLLP